LPLSLLLMVQEQNAHSAILGISGKWLIEPKAAFNSAHVEQRRVC
jgi:hypothetical protein